MSSLTCGLAAIALLFSGCASEAPPAADAPTSSTAAGTTQEAGASQALQEAIAGIDAAVYAYGVVGAHVRGSSQRQAMRAIAALDRQRAGFELALGSPVSEAAVAYALPGPVATAAEASALAELLEMKLLPLFDQVSATTTGAVHALAVNASRKAALRARFWQS